MRVYRARCSDPVPHKVIWRHPSRRSIRVGITQDGNELVFINKDGVFLLPVSSLAESVRCLSRAQREEESQRGAS